MKFEPGETCEIEANQLPGWAECEILTVVEGNQKPYLVNIPSLVDPATGMSNFWIEERALKKQPLGNQPCDPWFFEAMKSDNPLSESI